MKNNFIHVNIFIVHVHNVFTVSRLISQKILHNTRQILAYLTYICIWNSSGADEMPNGMCKYLYCPYGDQNVVR